MKHKTDGTKCWCNPRIENYSKPSIEDVRKKEFREFCKKHLKGFKDGSIEIERRAWANIVDLCDDLGMALGNIDFEVDALDDDKLKLLAQFIVERPPINVEIKLDKKQPN